VVRVAPKASRNAVTGLAAEADGGIAVKVAVTAAPEGGKANAALVKLLAKEWGVAKSDLSIMSGETGRRKTIEITADADRVQPQLAAWTAKVIGETDV
jgi:uncharacterized protein (TIGR00251 family)